MVDESVVIDLAEVMEPEEPGVIENEDGSIEFDFSDAPPASGGHNENLAELVADDDLERISSDLMEAIKSDEESNAEWNKMFAEGIKMLGINKETNDWPFEGASNIQHPMLMKAVTRFANKAVNEFLPASGPVKTEVVGAVTPEREEQADRVQEHMNYQLVYEMEEYFPDEDQAYTYLPIAGCVFKKVFFDPAENRPSSRLVLPSDLIVSYTTTDLRTAPRVTHKLTYQPYTLKRMMQSGFYRRVELAPPTDQDEEGNAVTDAKEQAEGRSPTNSQYDNEYQVYECHAHIDLPGFEDTEPDPDTGEPVQSGIELPYIVSIEKESGKVLSIRRNWREGSELKKPGQFFVKIPFIRGLGFYDWGYVHLIGGLAQGSTSILNQLIDAGTLANIPAGFKAKGVNFTEDDKPLKPGEFRDVEGYGEDIQKALLPLPFKGPNTVLAQLLSALVDAGDELVATAEMAPGDMPGNAPVGTANIMLEQANVVMSGIFKRIHAAKAIEFKLLHDLNSEALPMSYPYDVRGGDRTVYASDYDGRVDVMPVSDPNASSKVQRMTQAQALLQAATQPGAPQHDMRAVYDRMYRALGVEDVDTIMPPPPEAVTADPVSENGMLMAGRPVKPAITQNHQAHIQAHMAFGQMVMSNPATQASAQQLMPGIQAHINEHFAMFYTVTVAQQAGIPLEVLMSGKPLPPEIEAKVATAAAQATQQMAAQMAGPQQQQPDPAMAMVQVEASKVEQKEKDSQRDYDIERRKLMQDSAEAFGNQAIKEEELKLKAQEQGRKTAVSVKEAQDRAIAEINNRFRGAPNVRP